MAEDRFDTQFDNYQRSELVSTYQRDEGLLVIPVMGPAGTPPVIARVHAAYGTRTVAFNYAKQASPPLFPAIQDTVSGDTLMGASLSFPAPIHDQQNNLVFGVTGMYEYIQTGDGRTQGDTFPIDAHPFPTKVDLLGEKQIDITDPQLASVWGQWSEEDVDTEVLTGTKIIG